MNRLFFFINILGLCLLHTIAFGQKITAIVADEESRQAITDVFVFYDNSSTGAITDKNGKFELTATDFQNATLVFSHLNDFVAWL